MCGKFSLFDMLVGLFLVFSKFLFVPSLFHATNLLKTRRLVIPPPWASVSPYVIIVSETTAASVTLRPLPGLPSVAALSSPAWPPGASPWPRCAYGRGPGVAAEEEL